MSNIKPTIEVLYTMLKSMRSEFKEDLKELKEHTKEANSKVADIQEWRIKHDAEVGLIKRSIKFFVIPICVAMAVWLLQNWLG